MSQRWPRHLSNKEAHAREEVNANEGYSYHNDDTLSGPDQQWECLKHVRIKDYEPVEERFMSEAQRAQAARRRRDGHILFDHDSPTGRMTNAPHRRPRGRI